jgi:hypothetical protein|tara:strand:- start:36 stop:485 length:450 start_codon:yes stop_codon:yes gene_type:complete
VLKRLAVLALVLPSTGAAAQSYYEPPPPFSVPVIPVTAEKLNAATPCNIRKITKVTKGPSGKEILTSEMVADCGYDSNALAKSKYIIQKIREQDEEIKRLKAKPGQLVIKEIRYEKPVVRELKISDTGNDSPHMVVDFMIGILKGIKEL